MKRKVVNEKVIRAMAIGISAMLATATPMTALAAEGEGDNPEAPQAGGSEAEVNTVVDDAQAAGESAEASVEAAEIPVEKVTGDVETQVVTGEAGTDAEGNDLAQAVIDAAGDATGNDLTKADTTIETTTDNLDAAEGAIVSSDSSLDKAEDAYDDASDAAKEAVNTVNKANDAIDAKAGDISNAETIDEANAAYDELVDIADEAEKTFNTKLDEYNEAKSAYESAAADVKKYEQAYADAVDLADSNAEAALNNLNDAKAKAEALEDALKVAKASVDESAAAAVAIANKKKEVDSAGLNWKEEDKLFILIMENYYLPEVSNISDAKVTRVQGKDNDEYNYFKAVYTDETGKKCEKYFNFKLGENNKTKNEMIIFEKREVEIFGDPDKTPDRYVDSTGAVKNIDKGLKDGSIIAVVTDNGDGTQSTKYFETAKLGDATVGDVIESTEVTTVDKTTAKEEYKFDEEGNLVKEVTADVTTITYTDASFSPDNVYDSESARDDAADAKQKELEDAGAKGVDVNKTDNTTYVITGTYIPTFTKTVNVNKEYESESNDYWLVELGEKAKNEKEAKDKAYGWVKDQIGEDYCVVDIKGDLSVSMTEKESIKIPFGGKIVTNDSDYLVTGTVEATYAKVTKETVDQSTFGALWDDIKSIFGGQSTNEKLAEKAKAAIEADGGIFLSAEWADLSLNKATIRYVKAEKVVSDECDSVEKAEASLAAKILAQLNIASATGTYNESKNTESETKYSFNISYLEKSNEKTENKVVRTETYKDAEALKGQIIQNKNFLDGEYLMTRKDEKFRDFVDNGVAITGKYAALLTEAEAATKAVAEAQAEVDKLNEEIAKLKDRTSNLGALRTLEDKLATAEDNLKKAEGVLEKIKDNLEDAGVELEDVIERLTPAPGTPGTPGAPATEDGAPGEGPTTVVTTTTTTTAATNLALAGAGNAGGANAGNADNAGNGGNAGVGGVVNIDDEDTALAASVDDTEDTANVVEIGDEETPLAASVDNETMSWWWLLLIALLGATGYEMYKKHQQKKEALAETDDVQ